MFQPWHSSTDRLPQPKKSDHSMAHIGRILTRSHCNAGPSDPWRSWVVLPELSVMRAAGGDRQVMAGSVSSVANCERREPLHCCSSPCRRDCQHRFASWKSKSRRYSVGRCFCKQKWFSRKRGAATKPAQGRDAAGRRYLASSNNPPALLGGATPRCRYAASVAMRPRGVRCR